VNGTAVGRQEAWELPADPQVVAKAREMVRTVMIDWGLQELLEEVVLMMDEAVSNAIVHGRGPLTLLLAHTASRSDGPGGADTVLCEVSDTGPGRPQYRRADGGDEHGRGLAIIAALAQAYGVRDERPGQPGKTFWFSVPAPPQR
jgi:anti-sigma regulatory factor (Ser/Thr protein kinase)